MNKQIFTCMILCLAWCVSANAKVVTRQQALQKAQQFMVGKQFSEPVQRRGQMLSSPSEAYYVFNAERNGGFVIVAGDDRMPEILGYSDHGSLLMDSIPCGLKWLLAYYEQTAKILSEQQVQMGRSANRAAKASVAPFVKTIWGQYYPYDAQCPRLNGARTITGCVATAMAQIMNYYCWPNEVTEPIPAYTTHTNKIVMPQLEPTKFSWGHLNKNQLSKLMLYCGQAVRMDYGPKASGAGEPSEVLKQLFGYDDNLKFVYRDSYSEEQWNDMLYEELAAQRPIWYNGYGGDEGHAFILCGYNDDHYYINWGWDGVADGYYILDGISPAVGGYNMYQGAVIGIKPKGTPKSNTFYPRRIVMENHAWLDSPGDNGSRVSPILDRLASEYPDHFIGIDVHVSDNMEGAENYQFFADKFGYFPDCYVNRLGHLVDYEEMKQVIENQKDYAEAIVDVSATYSKPDKSAITVTTESQFGFDGTDEDFRLAFVVVEDNVKDNSYPSTYNNVARGIYGHALGIKGSVPATVEKGKTYHYEYSFTVPTPKWSWTTFKKENFRIVALLLDATTGEILNASQTPIEYDNKVDNLTFEFMNNGKKLASGTEVCWKSKGVAEDNLSMGTNLKANGLVLAPLAGKKVSGSAKLEILSNSMGSPTLNWNIGGKNLTLTDETTEAEFSIAGGNQMEVELTASDIKQFGTFEARLTATANGASQSVLIKFVHQESDVQIGGGAELQEGQRWWSNGSGGDMPDGYMQGTGAEEHYSVATYIPANILGKEGLTVDGVRFFGSTSCMSNIKVWISSHLPAIGEEPDIAEYSFPDDEFMVEQYNEMVFNHHFQIPEDGVYVGYSFEIFDLNSFRAGTPIVFCDKNRDNALWFRTDTHPEWSDRFGNQQGNLNMKILFGNVTEKNALGIIKVEPLYTSTNTSTDILIKVRNEGTEPIYSFDVEGDFGKTKVSIGRAFNPNEFNSYNYMYVPIHTGSEAVYKEESITITKIDGKPNESENKTAVVPLFISRKKSPSTVVLEEFTATWCGYSTQANLVMNELQEEFGDKLITICVHGNSITANDPMQISEYEDIRSLSGGNYPSLLINRQGNALDDAWTPFYDCDLDNQTKQVLDIMIPGFIQVGAEWADEAKSLLDIQTRTTFEVNADELPFRIGYVLLEDGMSGEGSEWAQSNIYSGIEEIYDNRLEDLTKLPALIYGQKYNNVAVAAWDAYKGVEGSLVGPFKAGVSVEDTFKADISGNTLIQNKENLSVVALIVNKETGKIINAAKCKIGDTLPLSITSTPAENGQFDVYDMQGRKVRHATSSLNGLPRGMYIINGRKVVK